MWILMLRWLCEKVIFEALYISRPVRVVVKMQFEPEEAIFEQDEMIRLFMIPNDKLYAG